MEAGASNQDNPPDTSNLVEDGKPLGEWKMNGSQEIHKRFFGITVEPVLFLALFGSGMSNILLTNLLLIRTCEYENLENCSTIDTHPGGPSEKLVQPYVTQLGMYKLVIESSVTTIIALFVGPWSDTYGRRPIMIFPLLGYCLNFILLIGFARFNVRPIFVLLTNAPLVLMGGSMNIFTGAFCYINDICPKKDLPLRLALTEAALYFGILGGNIAAPYLYPMFPSHGFEAIFSIGLVFCLSALLYVVFFLPESIVDNEHDIQERLKALVDYRQVIDLFRVCFGNHEGHCRFVRLVVVGVTLLSLISLEGTLAVYFLFTRNKFSWDAKEFSLFSDVSLLMGIFGTVSGTVVFTKWLKLSNTSLSCFAFFMKAVGYITGGLANSGWFMYLSIAVGSVGGMSSPVNRAIISETVPKKDIGKLFSIISAFMAAMPMVAGLTYVTLYNSTLDTFPGAVFLFSAALSIISCILIGSIIVHQFNTPHPYRLTNHGEEDTQIQS